MNDGSWGHLRGAMLTEAYSPASPCSGRATEFERMPPEEGRQVPAGERSGRLFRETEHGKKV